MPLALKFEDKKLNMRKAIFDLSAKIENLCSSEKELQKNIEETTTTLSSIQPTIMYSVFAYTKFISY